MPATKTNKVKNKVMIARSRAGLTQEALAHYVGCTPTQLGRIERGYCEPHVTLAIRIARVLGPSVEQIWHRG